MASRYDIVIVGGGPAGLSAAQAAANEDVSVAVLERDSSIGLNVRTSGVSWLDDIRNLEIPRELYNPLRKYHFYSPHGNAELFSDIPLVCVLDVRRTYQYLASEAAKSGADIYVGANVLRPVVQGNKVAGVVASVLSSRLTYASEIVIDASGFPSVVAKALGLVKSWDRFGVGAEFEAYVENLDYEAWTLMLGQMYSPAGYAWVFPVNKHIARIGTGVGRPESTANPVEILHEIMQKRHPPLDKFGKIAPIEFHQGVIPNEGPRHQSIYDGLILVGDSAGQANPIVLEGIRHAIQFGRIAGRVAAEAIRKNDTSRETLIAYEKSWQSNVERRFKIAHRLQKRYISFTDEWWDRVVEMLGKMDSKEVLDFMSANFTLQSIARFAASHPSIVVKELVRGILN